MIKQVNSLKEDISQIPFITKDKAEILKTNEIKTVRDLLFYIPYKYKDTSNILTIEKLKEVEEGSVLGLVESITRFSTRRFIVIKARIADDTGKLDVVWFNQPYLINVIKKGKVYIFDGKIKAKGKFLSLSSPEYELVDDEGEVSKTHLGRITPSYSAIGELSPKWFRSRISSLKMKIPKLFDSSDLAEAVYKIHFPENFEEIEQARAKLASDELLGFALEVERMKKAISGRKSKKIEIDRKLINEFIGNLGYSLTFDQKKVLDEILHDISDEKPMYRLLNGDVGSGKTIVSLITSLLCVRSKLSVIYLAPTTILAQQHYETIKKTLKNYKVKVQLLISGYNLTPVPLSFRRGASRGEVSPQIIIGTHALLYEANLPQNVGLVIVDEQHRFGVGQREKLKNLTFSQALDQFIPDNSKFYPHYLTMTATPIPRTLTHILFGDMDVSIIKEMPKNRLPIKSYLVSGKKEDDCYKWINKKIVDSGNKEQAFIIYPLIEESEVLDAKAAVDGFNELSKKEFKNLKVGLLHGRMKDEEKNEVLMKFRNKKFNVLVATSVVEVGIDIPDATMMVIQNAERFGLAQLHQLRGRIGRGDLQSHCFVFMGKKTVKSQGRLKYFCTHNSGFDVAEYDLKSRGPGEVYGFSQSGIPRFKIADIFDLEGLKKARENAKVIIEMKSASEQKRIEENLFH